MPGSVKHTETPLIVLQGVVSAQTEPVLTHEAAMDSSARIKKTVRKSKRIIMLPPLVPHNRWSMLRQQLNSRCMSSQKVLFLPRSYKSLKGLWLVRCRLFQIARFPQGRCSLPLRPLVADSNLSLKAFPLDRSSWRWQPLPGSRNLCQIKCN